MIVGERKSVHKTNFISKNIQICSNPHRAVLASPIFTVEGVSVLLYRKGKFKQKRTPRQQPEKKGIEVFPKPAKKRIAVLSEPAKEVIEVLPKSILKTPPQPLLTSKSYPGIRRTSIKSKEERLEESRVVIKKRVEKGDLTAKRREVLKLAITKLPVVPVFPVYQESSRSLLLKVAGRAFLRYKGLDSCEALEDVERFLSAMDSSHGQSTTENRAESLKSHLQSSMFNNKEEYSREEVDTSYHQVYKCHVDKLTQVIAQEETANNNRSSDNKKKKRKLGPKLEIKLGGAANESCISINELTQELEDFHVLDVDNNRGDLTPVITYNHVTTVSTPDEFQYGTASPGGSSKGSRSPSPLLEVPAKGILEISTKFPAS